MHLYVISAILIPLLGPVYFWLKPELPITSGITFITNYPVFRIFSHFRAWSFFGGSCCFSVINGFMIPCQCLKSYSLLYHEAVNKTISQKHTSLSTIQLYRHIQILERIFNTIFSTYGLMTVLQWIAAVVQIFSFYLIIKLHSTLTIPQWILVALMGGDSLLFSGFVFGVAAKVHQRSTESLLLFQRKSKVERDPWMKRFYRSSWPIKIGFGSVSYVGSLTPLSFMNFNIYQTANLSMLR